MRAAVCRCRAENALPGIVFSNFVEMVDELAQKPDVYGCFTQQFAAYARDTTCRSSTPVKERLADDFAAHSTRSISWC